MELAHGRGLFLMRELMDRMEYRRGGSEVILFQRPV
jgi:anti-sigma regulatory factor (Ser/Thr protein kinase)